jgi:hypothetical protein
MKHTHETRWLATELKFLVTPDCASRLKEWSKRHLEIDPHASPEIDGYLVTSLYCDTPEFHVYHQNGSYGHAKYRLRRYGDGAEVFLERKLRNRQMVVKRRSIVGVTELGQLQSGLKPDPEWGGYWFHRRIVARGLRPVCQVAYHRTARVAESENGPIRLTIDRNLHAKPVAGAMFEPGGPGEDLLDDRLIVEMKFREGLPELFRRAIEEFGLRPETISKYKLAARRLDLADDEDVAGPETFGIAAAPASRYGKVRVA